MDGLVLANRGGDLPAVWPDTVLIVALIALFAVGCLLIALYLRRSSRRPKRVADQWQALAVMGELCPHGWRPGHPLRVGRAGARRRSSVAGAAGRAGGGSCSTRSPGASSSCAARGRRRSKRPCRRWSTAAARIRARADRAGDRRAGPGVGRGMSPSSDGRPGVARRCGRAIRRLRCPEDERGAGGVEDRPCRGRRLSPPYAKRPPSGST